MIEAFGASGELSGLDFPKLLIYLNDIRFDGKALINIGKYKKSLFISKGHIAYALSNDPQDSLGSVLVNYQIINDDQLKISTEEAKTRNISLGKIIIEKGYTTSEELIRGAALQIREVIKSLILAEEYSYFLKKEFLPENIVDQKVNPYQVTFDSFLDMKDMEWIHKQLGSSKRIFKQSSDFVERYRKLLYTEETDLIVARIDGKTDIQTLMQIPDIDPNRVKKILASLYVMNMLKIVTDSSLDRKKPGAFALDQQVTQQVDPKQMAARASESVPTDVKEKVDEKTGDTTENAKKTTKPEDKKEAEKKIRLDEQKLKELRAQMSKPEIDKEEIKEISGEIEVKQSLGDLQKLRYQDQISSKPSMPWQEGDIKDAKSTAQYQQMLERQRRKIGKTSWITLILILMFGSLAAYYFLIYQKEPLDDAKKDRGKSTTVSSSGTRTTSGIEAGGKQTAGMDILATVRPVTKRMMSRGKYNDAARAWQDTLEKQEGYTISIEIACANSSIVQAYGYDRNLEKLFLLPRTIKGRSCYRVCWGIYPTMSSAEEAYNSLPAYYQRQRPRPVPINLKSLM